MLLDEPFSALDTGLRDEHAQGRGQAAERRRHHHDPGHPRSGRSAVLRRPGRGAARRAAGAGRLAARALSQPRDRGTAAFLGDAIVLPAELGDGWAECRLGRVACRRRRAARRGRDHAPTRAGAADAGEHRSLRMAEEPDACFGRVFWSRFRRCRLHGRRGAAGRPARPQPMRRCVFAAPASRSRRSARSCGSRYWAKRTFSTLRPLRFTLQRPVTASTRNFALA